MDDSRLYLVFEFVPMDLKKFIDTRPKKHLDEALTKSFTYQVFINYYLLRTYVPTYIPNIYLVLLIINTIYN